MNTLVKYGSFARLLHWSVAILVLVDLVLGVVGSRIPRTAETVDFLKLLYSAHKTIGVLVLGLAVVRVVWALTQPHPVPLHPERKLETFAAQTAHWLLYAAIFVLPLSGWIMHSAEVGFAPIWWPFGQDLPFVPKSEDVAHSAGMVHWIAGMVLTATVAAHIGGALKHAFFDRDETLERMLRGREAGDPLAGHGGKFAPAVAAFLIWAFAIGGALTLFAQSHDAPALATPVEQPASGWNVVEGSLEITVQQLGAPVTGAFTNWTAAIDYDDALGMGQVTTVIDTTSLSLGSVTDQAKGPEFFNISSFAQSTFVGDIARIDGNRHSATGTLELVGQTIPVTFEFDLMVADGNAKMIGDTVLDRRDFGMGASYPDESNVGFSVGVTMELTAQRAE